MEIVPGKSIGKWILGKSRDEIVELISGEYKKKESNIVTKDYEFVFDSESCLKCIIAKGKSNAEFKGIRIGSNLLEASKVFGTPIFDEDCEIIFEETEGISFDLGPAKTELLYETGAMEDRYLDAEIHELNKLKIKSILVYKA